MGVKTLSEPLVFEHSDFHLSAHDSSRITALIDGFVEQGRLTKEPARECRWLDVTLVERMIDTVFWSTWVYTLSMTAERTVSILQTTLTRGAAQASCQSEITNLLLTQHLPKYKKYIHANSNLVYTMIRRHEKR